MSKQLVKNNLNVDAARSFVDTVTNDVPYYIFAATKPVITETISTPTDTRLEDVNIYDNLLFGKRIKSTDIKLSIKRYDWIAGQVYDMYDDSIDLTLKRFYASTDTGLEVRVYKCLFNNNGGPSTVEPFGTSTESFENLADGYVWKYMYTISKLEMNRFATLDYIPVIEDTNVTAAAQPGTIDVIKIISAGAGYNNYISGDFDQPDDIEVSGDPLIYDIRSGSSTDKFYVNCMIKITSDQSQNGQYRLIVDYRVVNGRKLITLDRPFDITPVPGDGYEISPNVFIRDLSDTATEECYARAIINSNTGNTISRIEILNPGLGYRKARAVIIPDGTVGVTPNRQAEVRPIISPDEGHGYDPTFELMAKYACVSGVFNGNTGPIIADNSFSTFGLLKEPLYADCELTIDTDTVKGEFLPGEIISRYRPIKLAGNVEVFANTLVLGSNTALIDSLQENDPVIITNGLTNIFGLAKNINYFTPENANAQLIESIESFNITVNAEELPFVAANCDIYLINKTQFAECVEYNLETIRLTNVNPTGFSESSYVIGEESFATAKMSSNTPYLTIAGRGLNVTVNGILLSDLVLSGETQTYLTTDARDANDFDAFNQLTRLVGYRDNPLSTFVPNETLIQNGGSANNQAEATFHSFESVAGPSGDYLYVTNVINSINVPELGSPDLQALSTNREADTQTQFIINQKYDGELVRDSGEILYVENINAIQRRNTQTELVKLILEF